MKRVLLLILSSAVWLGAWACTFPLLAETPGPGPADPLEKTVVFPATPVQTGTAEQAGLVEVTVYFTDGKRYATGIPPFEAGVTRQVEAGAFLPEAVLVEFFEGPTEQEQTLGLERVASGFTGFSELVIEDGIARVYLTGDCRSNGATYTIAQPIIANLSQFEEVRAVKIYDENGTTENPDGPGHSIPFCLEP